MMKIDLNRLKIPANYCLILPDESLDTYQIAGRETNLIAPDFKYEGIGDNQKRISVKERNLSASGTVYRTPEQLNFYLKEMEEIKRNHNYLLKQGHQVIWADMSILKQIGAYEKDSVMFDVPMEVKVGDSVTFTYTEYKKCQEEGRVIETEHGDMLLVCYDKLYMTIDEHKNPIKMLNGWMLIEPEEIEVKVEGAQEFIEKEHGIVLLAPKTKLRKNRKNTVGTVLKAGCICKGYLQEPDKHDGGLKLKPEDKVVYDSRACMKLEYETHQIYSEKTLHLLQRKDVWFGTDKDFDFSKLSLERRRKQNV